MSIEEAKKLVEVIKFLMACRDTHVDAVQWYDDGEDESVWILDRGDREFHADCITEYDAAIKMVGDVYKKLLWEVDV